MLGLQARGIGRVRLDRSEVLDPSGQIGTGCQVLGGIAVALLPPLVQREIDHHPQRHRRGQRVFLCKDLGGRGEEIVVIAINLVLPVNQQSRGVAKRLPVQKEGQGGQEFGMRWSPKGAHRVAVTKAAVLDGRLTVANRKRAA